MHPEGQPSELKKNPIDPMAKYGTPENLLNDQSLSEQDKRKLLKQWKHDLTLLLTATEENMTPQTKEGQPSGTGDNAELLRRVSDCLLRMKAPTRASTADRRRDS